MGILAVPKLHHDCACEVPSAVPKGRAAAEAEWGRFAMPPALVKDPGADDSSWLVAVNDHLITNLIISNMTN